MVDQRATVGNDQPVVFNNHDQEASESCSGLTTAVDQAVVHGSVMVVRSNSSRQAKGVLDVNVVEKRDLKVEKVPSSCAIDVQLDGDEDDGDAGREMLCRICHLTSDQSPERFGITSDGGKMKEPSLVQLGCGCKDEMGVAHSHCAETWFKLKGNRICEICGEAARNITGIVQEPMLLEWNDRGSYTSGANYSPERSRRWCRRQPCCIFLVVCLMLALVPWFFRVKFV